MKRSIAEKAEQLKLFWKNYVFQSLFAGLVILVVLLVLSSQEAVIIASIGATAFIVFAMPNSIAARPVNIIGGQLVGFACGYLCGLIPHESFLAAAVIYSLAVGLSIFIMVVTGGAYTVFIECGSRPLIGVNTILTEFNLFWPFV